MLLSHRCRTSRAHCVSPPSSSVQPPRLLVKDFTDSQNPWPQISCDIAHLPPPTPMPTSQQGSKPLRVSKRHPSSNCELAPTLGHLVAYCWPGRCQPHQMSCGPLGVGPSQNGWELISVKLINSESFLLHPYMCLYLQTIHYCTF